MVKYSNSTTEVVVMNTILLLLHQFMILKCDDVNIPLSYRSTFVLAHTQILQNSMQSFKYTYEHIVSNYEFN